MTDKKDNVLDVFQVKLLENYDIGDSLSFWLIFFKPYSTTKRLEILAFA